MSDELKKYIYDLMFHAMGYEPSDEYILDWLPRLESLINQQERETVEKVNKIYEDNFFATLTNEEMMKRLSELNQLEEK